MWQQQINVGSCLFLLELEQHTQSRLGESMDKSASMTHARQLVQQALPSHCRTCCVPGRSERVSLAEGRWEAALVILKEVRSDTMCGPSSYASHPTCARHSPSSISQPAVDLPALAADLVGRGWVTRCEPGAAGSQMRSPPPLSCTAGPAASTHTLRLAATTSPLSDRFTYNAPSVGPTTTAGSRPVGRGVRWRAVRVCGRVCGRGWQSLRMPRGLTHLGLYGRGGWLRAVSWQA